MNILSLVHYTAFLMYVWLILFILSKNPKAKLNKVCALLFVCFAIWNFALTFYYAAVLKNTAMLWLNISSFCWCSLGSFFLWFSLVFTNREKILKKWYFYVFIFFIPAILIFKQWTGYMRGDNIQQFYGWTSTWSISIWPWFLYVYYFLFLVISFYLYLEYIFGKKTKYKYERKQAMLIVATSTISLISGTITDILLPQLKMNVVPPIGSILILIWAGGIVYAITKYKLMVLTPAYAAADILSTMSDSLILIGPEGKLIEVNTATLNLLGFSKEEIINKPAEILFSEEVPLFKGTELEKLLQKGLRKDYQMSFQTKNGMDIPVSFSGSVMRDKDDNLIGIVGIARDMREILRLQESEREFIVEKARSEALQERAQELQEAYDKLRAIQTQLIQSEKMAAVGQLAGGVAHEINNPMGVILGFAQSIVKRVKDDDPLYMPLKSIEREAIRCKKLVGDLLTFSRIGKTQAELIDINQTIDETLSLIEARTKTENIEIIREYTTGLPPIMANKNQIQQVIMNLCNNAVDAMPDSGRITIITRQIENQIGISINDTGKGMTEEVKKHIFEPFFTTKEIGKGTGLGLSLCYEIVQRHNGTIEVECEINKGSIFRLKLPINER